MKRLRVGIAGYGIVGSKRHSCLKMHRNVDIIAVCDRNKDQKKNLDKSIKFFNDYVNLLKEDLDAVFVCMPNDMAPKVCKKATTGRATGCQTVFCNPERVGRALPIVCLAW